MNPQRNPQKLANPATRSFLLRTWRSEAGSDTAWRVFLIDPVSGEQTVFTTLDALTGFLRELLGEPPPPAGSPPDPTE